MKKKVDPLPPPLATAVDDMRPAPILPAEIPAPVNPKPQTTPTTATGAKTAPAVTPPAAAPPTTSAVSTPLKNNKNKVQTVPSDHIQVIIISFFKSTCRRLGAKGSYLTLVRVADRILQLRGDDVITINY